MENWTDDDRVEDARPPIVVFNSEWENWIAEVETTPSDDELNDMEARSTN